MSFVDSHIWRVNNSSNTPPGRTPDHTWFCTISPKICLNWKFVKRTHATKMVNRHATWVRQINNKTSDQVKPNTVSATHYATSN